MSNQQKRRHRGIILTTEGLRKLQEGIVVSANPNNYGERYSLQQLGDRTLLSLRTIRRVLNQTEPVDKKSISIFFQSFGLELLPCDYEKPKPAILEKRENHHQDWGISVDVADFYGQEENIATLTDLVLKQHCRLILLLGMGGVGKTYLSIHIAKLIQDKFDFVVWRSLKEGISCQEMVDNLGSIFSQEKKTKCSLTELINYLRRHKCLLILDGLETILAPKNHQGKYQETYQDYSKLVDILGRTDHQSCVIITSREKPEKINFLEEKEGKIQSFHLKGNGCDLIPVNVNKNLILEKGPNIFCDYYDDNYVLLKMILKYINPVFEGEIEQFIVQETRLFNEINSFLTEHFERLSPLELMIIKQFQNEENSLNIKILHKITSYDSPIELWQGLQSLKGRSILSQNGSNFTIKPLIKDYLKHLNSDK